MQSEGRERQVGIKTTSENGAAVEGAVWVERANRTCGLRLMLRSMDGLLDLDLARLFLLRGPVAGEKRLPCGVLIGSRQQSDKGHDSLDFSNGVD